MSSPSRSRSRSPLRWDYKRNGQQPEPSEHSTRRHTRERSASPRRSRPNGWAPWRPQHLEPLDATEPAGMDPSGRINPFYSNIMVKADIVPEFDPEKSEIPSLQWLNKIEQLGAIHGWPDHVKSYYMQARLTGLAKMWHNALRSYEFTWFEWKQKVLEAFPQNIDYAEALKDMLSRKKVPNETIIDIFIRNAAYSPNARLLVKMLFHAS